jgi:D-beta-D-heptose 7-phosphate kinase/D-beta-D-heptose 1-phosphate adenosyltransferase
MKNKFSKANVLIVGDVMLDKYYHGSTTRISPEAPVPIVKVKNEEFRVGGAANVAKNVAALGANVALVSITGLDDDSELLEKSLISNNIKCFFQKEQRVRTTSKLRVISQHQQLIRLDFEDDYKDITLSLNNYKKQLDSTKVVVISDYAKGVLTDVQNIIKIARDKDIDVIIDPKGHDFEKYRGATLLTPNLSEFEAVVGICKDSDEIVSKGQKLINDYQLDALLITRSEQGMTLLKKDKTFLHLPTHAQDVFDVTGAGDTVVAMLATALASGEDFDEATKLANIAAGIVVAKVGTAVVELDELLEKTQPKTKIFNQDDLKTIIKNQQKNGEKVVFTNGCFDLLHPGHIHYLAQAKSLGDKLIVAVNSDSSVKVLKGNSRPINDLEARMQVLAGLESIDYLVDFATQTPEKLICSLQPDVLVKGGDYKAEDVAGYDCVVKNGGSVQIVDFVAGHSSSKIINNMKG